MIIIKKRTKSTISFSGSVASKLSKKKNLISLLQKDIQRSLLPQINYSSSSLLQIKIQFKLPRCRRINVN